MPVITQTQRHSDVADLVTDHSPLAGLLGSDIYCPSMEPVKPAAYEISDETAEDRQEVELRALVMRIAAQDQAALETLYDHSGARLYGLARRITADNGAAEEVVADTYWQIWQQAARYDAARGRVLAWMLTICRSRALDWRRRQDRAEIHPEPEMLRPDLYEDHNNPLDLMQAMQRDSRVHSALARLDAGARHLLGLAFFQGLSHQEIAAVTGMPLGSVKTILRKSMQVLKRDLSLASVTPEDCS